MLTNSFLVSVLVLGVCAHGGNAFGLSLVQQRAMAWSGSMKDDPASAGRQGTCDDWCSGELFTKIEANKSVMKNLSSWSMKCDWFHCGGCSACDDPTLHTHHEKKIPEQLDEAKTMSCDDWCSSETFEAVTQNTTLVKTFSWKKKCAWLHCGACSSCSALSLSETSSGTKLQHAEEPDSQKGHPSVAGAQATCDDWCSGDLFTKIEANKSVMKNLSSWSMKCDWFHCGACSACNDPSVHAYHHTKNVAEQLDEAKTMSCDDWCSSETFEAVTQNTTLVKRFSWNTKCAWRHCGACTSCSELSLSELTTGNGTSGKKKHQDDAANAKGKSQRKAAVGGNGSGRKHSDAPDMHENVQKMGVSGNGTSDRNKHHDGPDSQEELAASGNETSGESILEKGFRAFWPR